MNYRNQNPKKKCRYAENITRYAEKFLHQNKKREINTIILADKHALLPLKPGCSGTPVS